MLKELLPLLRKGDTLGLSIAMEGDNLYRINVLPKLFTPDGENSADRKALNTPLSITGTAEELDSPEFVETLTRFSTSATTLRHTIEEVEAHHKSAAASALTTKSAEKKIAAAKPASKSTPKPAVKPAATGKVGSWKDRLKSKTDPAKPEAEKTVSAVSETEAQEQASAETTASESEAPTETEASEPPRNAAEATQSLI